MSASDYNSDYFNRYLVRSRFSRRRVGEQGVHQWCSRVRRRIGEGARLLEVGAGLGYFGAEASTHFDYVGTDLSPDAVAWSREVHGLNMRVADAHDLPFDNGSFDGVIAFDVVEHLADPATFFAQAYRVLRPGGYFLIRTPNTESFGVRLKRNHPTLTASMYRDPTHCSLFAPPIWRHLIREAGFRMIGSGTDGLWDLPYSSTIPLNIQKIAMIPLNHFLNSTACYLPWSLGENLIVESNKSS